MAAAIVDGRRKQTARVTLLKLCPGYDFMIDAGRGHEVAERFRELAQRAREADGTQ